MGHLQTRTDTKLVDFCDHVTSSLNIPQLWKPAATSSRVYNEALPCVLCFVAAVIRLYSFSKPAAFVSFCSMCFTFQSQPFYWFISWYFDLHVEEYCSQEEGGRDATNIRNAENSQEAPGKGLRLLDRSEQITERSCCNLCLDITPTQTTRLTTVYESLLLPRKHERRNIF